MIWRCSGHMPDLQIYKDVKLLHKPGISPFHEVTGKIGIPKGHSNHSQESQKQSLSINKIYRCFHLFDFDASRKHEKVLSHVIQGSGTERRKMILTPTLLVMLISQGCTYYAQNELGDWVIFSIDQGAGSLPHMTSFIFVVCSYWKLAPFPENCDLDKQQISRE